MNKSTILVTGGSGYLGSWVVKGLLEKGYTVRIAVRDKNNTKKVSHLHDIAANAKGNIELWEADLLKEGSFDAAAKGCETIYHMASPFMLDVKNPQKDLVDPALIGTRNVLNAATRSETVTRVVLTSSVVAIMGDNTDLQERGVDALDERFFNESSSLTHQPYSYSKVLAEKEAWKMEKEQEQWKLVVLNPSFVMGPTLTPSTDSESLNFMKQFLGGQMFMAPDLTFGWVDVRDVAKAHILAGENQEAEGRHLLAENTYTVLQVGSILRKVFGKKYLLPKYQAPKFMLYLTGWMFGLSTTYVKKNVGIPLKLNNTKSLTLGLTYTPIEKTMTDMVNQMETLQLIK
ncbi:NAD-dependent epimerase/dehydratase family protein [Algivirga pacifica]|uniref:NAD-dependent epimerase/dehydratase family protein n=1 Tax=Algivirga pacifica TaxID=1162670 RepID=A0ABP9DBZ2_9BACT